jgi:hypothetical protein
MASKSNPNNIGVTNTYAGNVAPKRADQSTILPGGNRVNRKRINPTRSSVSKNKSSIYPGGESR